MLEREKEKGRERENIKWHNDTQSNEILNDFREDLMSRLEELEKDYGASKVDLFLITDMYLFILCILFHNNFYLSYFSYHISYNPWW